jgi:hypothetical protein
MTAIVEPPTATSESPAPAVPSQRVASPPPAAPPAKRVLTPTGVRLLGAVLVALFAVASVVEPAPDGPEPVLTATEQFILLGMAYTVVAALAGFLLGRRWALQAALVFSGLMGVGVALCPTTGHHVVGGWWFTQVAATAAMIALPALALARTRGE